MTVLLTPAAKRFLAEKRREAVEIVTHGDAFTPSQRDTAWAALAGMCPHPQARRQAVNLGAPAPCEGWALLATVIEAGMESWSANDA